MSKKVLILCQRKQGLDTVNINDVKDTVIPLINEYVENVLGPDTTIEYLTDGDDPTVEYNFTLDKHNPKAAEFISTHKGTYSLIILNTCPLIYMDYELIYSLLEPNGFMVFQAFPQLPPKIPEDLFYVWSSKEGVKEIIQFLEQNFRHISYPDFDPINYYVYQKIERGGGKYNLKKNNKKTIKKRNYKKRNNKKRNNKKTIKKRNFSS